MKNLFKRVLCLLLVLVLTGSMLPTVFATGSGDESTVLTDEDYASADAVFAQIDAMEDAPATKNASEAELTDKAIALVMASDSYVDGSLERNGDSFTWMTTDGIRCLYSSQTRDRKSLKDNKEVVAESGIYNEPVPTKGGWPASKQVYLIGPYYHDPEEPFTDQYKKEATDIAAAIGDTDGYTLYSGTAATIDKVAEAMSNGAVVIFDSHGTTDYAEVVGYYSDGTPIYECVTGATSSYLCLSSKSGLTTADFNAGNALYGSGNEAYVNGTAIAQRMTKNSPGGILWMAICLGMATDGMYAPFRNKGVEVVYGYSQSVTFEGDYLYEETFWDNMIAGSDVATSIAAMKTEWGNWDWTPTIAQASGYSGGYSTISAARSDYAAFPIVVSDEDSHPGQKTNTFYGADSLQTVKSTYTLYPQYEITVQSNNTAYGTASFSGTTVTATPANGYFTESATVLSGNATVSQNGNTFTVNAQSDCTIQINFAPKTPVTVSFSGATVASQNGYAGDSMTLPTVEAPDGYKFLGWMNAPLTGDTTEKPSFYTTSFTPTGNTTLYALYSYVDENTSTGTGDYVKVTETPTDWSGEYLIVYEAGNLIFDGSLTTLDAKNNVQSVTISNSIISAAKYDQYKFIVSEYNGGYSIQSASGQYIGGKAGENKITTSTSPIKNTISLAASGDVNIDSSGALQYNAGDNRFRYYSKANQTAIALYVKDGINGTTYYTTSIVKCEHLNTTNVAAVAATCTTGGYTAGVQCLDCDVFISGHTVIAAQGHSYASVVTPPTATEQGYTTYTCGVCGYSYVSDYVEALGQTYTVSFSVPAGVTPIEAMLCGKNGITLPSAGVPTGEYTYTFAGWVVQQVESTETAPEIYPAGQLVTIEGDITLYALYSYTEAGTDGIGKYTLVTDTSALKAGAKVVIASNAKGFVAGNISNQFLTHHNAAFSSDMLTITNLPADTLELTLGGSAGAWTLTNNSGQLLGATSVKKLAWNSGTTTWNISISSSDATIQNNTSTYGRFLYNVSSPRFTTYTSSISETMLLPQLYMLSGSAGITYYTTEFGTKTAAVYGGDQQVAIYETVEEAYAACAEGYYVKLLADSEIKLTLNKDLVLDLNGFTLTGTLNPGSYAIYGIDSKTDDYDNADQGLLSCAGITNQIVPHLQIGTKRYMAIQEESGWSFHRYYLGITHINLSTTTTGIGYKAVFHGDSAVMAQLNSDRAFGYTLRVNGGREVSRYMSAEKMVSGKPVTLRVNNFDAEKQGEKILNAYVSVVLGNYIIKSAVHQVTLRQVVESINENYTNFKQAQLDAVKAMIENNPAMLNWQVANIMKEEEIITVPTVFDPVPGTAYKFGMIQSNVSSTDIYYLNGNMDSYYMATTTDPTTAIDVYIEEATNGYYLYAIINGSKNYINMVVSGTHVNGIYEATASTVYRYDTSARTVIANINGTDYHFGTRNDKTYTTIGPCATSYNGFYGMFYKVPQN